MGFAEKALPDAASILMPIGDGGEGTLDALAENLNLEKKSIKIPHAYTSDGSVSFNQQWPDCHFLKWLRFVAWSTFL
ncbi:MAG: glycerate kinase [Streptococcus salivarius]